MSSVLKVNSLQNSDSVEVLSTTPAGSPSFPNKPIMSGQMGAAVGIITGPAKIPFSEFWVDQGGITYDSVNRRFYVPDDGVYRITFTGLTNNAALAVLVMIGKNTDAPTDTTHFGRTYGPGSQFYMLPLNSVVSANAGDYFVFYVSQGQVFNSSGAPYGQFIIEKIA